MKPLAASLCLLLIAGCTDAGSAPASTDAVASAAAPSAQNDAASAEARNTVPTPEPAVFCPAGDTVVFGCRSAAAIDAVCASADGRLDYRSGPSQGAPPPSVYPEAGTAPAQAFRGDTLAYSGGGGAFLRFEHQGQVHTLYTGIGRGWEKAGVVIASAGGAAIERSCDGDVVSQIGPALFAQYGIPTDPDGFEMP